MTLQNFTPSSGSTVNDQLAAWSTQASNTSTSSRSTTVNQMVSFLKQQFGGDITAFNKWSSGQDYASWDAMTAHFMASSPSVDQLLSGKMTFDQWKAMQFQGSPTTSGDKSQRDAYATLMDTLNQYGLGGLAGWLWGEITADKPESQIFLDLRQQDAYKKRFAGIVARQKEGLPAISEADYLSTEEAYRQQLMRLGVPASQLTDPQKFVNYFAKDISPTELSTRVDVWENLNNAPGTTARLKGLFETYAGVKGASNADLYSAIVGADTSALQKIAGTTFQEGNFTVDQLQSEFKKAVNTEAATFRGGGGVIAENQGVKNLLGAEGNLT